MTIREYINDRPGVSARALIMVELGRTRKEYLTFTRWLSGKTKKPPTYLRELEDVLTIKYFKPKQEATLCLS